MENQSSPTITDKTNHSINRLAIISFCLTIILPILLIISMLVGRMAFFFGDLAVFLPIIFMAIIVLFNIVLTIFSLTKNNRAKKYTFLGWISLILNIFGIIVVPLLVIGLFSALMQD